MGLATQKLVFFSLVALLSLTSCLQQQEGAQTGLITPPPDPTGFTGVADSTSQISLSWASGGGSTTKFRLSYQSGGTAPADCDSGTQVSEQTLGSSTGIAVSGLTGGQWSFRLCAINANPTPDASDGATVSTYLLPPNISGLTSTSPSTSQIRLSWTSGGGSTSGYRIAYQAASANAPADCSAAQVTEGSITGTTHDVSGLTAGQLYSFRVCAINPNSDVASGVTATDSVFFNASWTARRRITFSNGAISETLSSFPVLVTLNASRINYANVQDAGEDLRFIDRDGATLDFEIEEWNEGGNSYVWVEVPNINANDSADYILMYYGNAGAADGQNQANTWNSAYKAVWHMGAVNPGDSLGTNNGTGNGGVATATGAFSTGLSFVGDNLTDFVSVAANASINIGGDSTIEAWFKLSTNFNSSSPVSRNLITKFQSNNTESFLALTGTDYSRVESPDGALVLKVENSDNRIFKWTNTVSWTAGDWYYIAATLDGTTNANTKIYVNGTDDTNATTVLENGDGNDLSYNSTWGIGGQSIDSGNFTDLSGGGGPVASRRYFDGLMDEVRISSVARSPSWIAAQNLSMTDSYLTFGSEETP